MAWPAAAAHAAASRTIGYSIAQRGEIGADMREFAEIVDATLNDPRGWSLGGSVRFQRAEHGELAVTLTSPKALGDFTGAGCTSVYSCRVGALVMINAERWARATPTYPGPSLLHPYRQMVINHEVGHALGFDHSGCAGPGQLAPLMQQQSKALSGCYRNPWPLPSERAALASRYGVAVAPPAPTLVLGKLARGIGLGERRRRVAARLGPPATRVFTPNGTEEGYPDARLQLAYVSGRVQAATTWSPLDVTAKGLAVGVGRQQLERTLDGEQCATSPDDGLLHCVWYRGDRASTFILRDDSVVAIRIALPPPAIAPPAAQ